MTIDASCEVVYSDSDESVDERMREACEGAAATISAITAPNTGRQSKRKAEDGKNNVCSDSAKLFLGKKLSDYLDTQYTSVDYEPRNTSQSKADTGCKVFKWSTESVLCDDESAKKTKKRRKKTDLVENEKDFKSAVDPAFEYSVLLNQSS